MPKLSAGIMIKRNKIYNLDCREGLKLLDDDSIDCCISSPPYWSLRDYGIKPSVWDGDPECEHNWIEEITKRLNASGGKKSNKLQIKEQNNFQEFVHYKKRETKSEFCQLCGAWLGCLGLEPTFELYIKHLADIYDLVKQKLKKSGTCFVNLGDTYGSGGGKQRTDEEYKKDHERAIKKGYTSGGFGEGNKSQGRSGRNPINTTKQGVPAKCLLMIPQRFAIEMISRGWILRNVIIWHKPNCMPSSAKDRFTVDFEYVYFFVKAKKYWFEQQREPHLEESKRRAMRGININKYTNSEYGQDLHKPRKYEGYKNMNEKIKSGETNLNPQGRNKRCVWTIPTKPNPEAHFATFPPNLVKPMILSGCPIDGIVLDPFAGTGTTLKTAFGLGRNYIGFEISKEYCTEIATKILESTKNKRIMEFF
jgi:site-specific DNA-methyltransferase (adenine-specific)